MKGVIALGLAGWGERGLAGLLIALSLVDFASLWFPSVGWVGLLLIVAAWAALGWEGGRGLCAIAARLREREAIAGAAALALLLAFAVWGVSAAHPLHDELAVEIQCTLEQIGSSPDAGFGSLCHHGYPTRQYYLSALPSLLLGRCPVALKLGGTLPLILGLALFVSGAIAFFGASGAADWALALALSLLVQSRFVIQWLVNPEQALFPISYSLAAVGLCLRYLVDKSTRTLLLILILLWLGAFAYTPTLSLLALGFAGLVALARREPSASRRRLIGLGLILLAGACLRSIELRRDLSLDHRERFPVLDVGHGEQSLADERTIGARFRHTARQLLLPETGLGSLSGFAHAIELLVLAACLTTRLGAVPFWLAIWVIATTLAGGTAAGHAILAPGDQIQRATVTWPITLVLALLLLDRAARAGRWLREVPAVLLVGSLLALGIYLPRVLSRQKDTFQLSLVHWLAAKPAGDLSGQPCFLMLPASFEPRMRGFSAYSRYLYPRMELGYLEACRPIGVAVTGRRIYLTLPSHPCAAELERDGFRQIAGPADEGGKTMLAFTADQ